jgi:hypothetical protein
MDLGSDGGSSRRNCERSGLATRGAGATADGAGDWVSVCPKVSIGG